MNGFFEENKTLIIIISALVIFISIIFLIKSIFFYSPQKGEEPIMKPAEETEIENLIY